MLSMITRKCEGAEFHERIHPTFGLNRVLNERALFIRIESYPGFDVILTAFPKLQYIINPRSWVVLLNCSFSNNFIRTNAAFNKALSLVYWYKCNKVPGKNPLTQPSGVVVFISPSSNVRG